MPGRQGSSCPCFCVHTKDGDRHAFGSLNARKTVTTVYLVFCTSKRPGSSCIWFPALTKDRDHRLSGSLYSRKIRIVAYLIPCTPERPGASCFSCNPKRPGSSCMSFSALPKHQDYRVFVFLCTHQKSRSSCTWSLERPEDRDHCIFGSLHVQKTRIIL